ncbi:hypothetical protein ACFL6P_03275 [Candidatus Latescibacterota bacterium]
MTTEERLNKLEREVDRTKRINRVLVLLLFGVCLSLWLFGGVNSTAQQGVADEIRARKVLLVDNVDRNRIVLDAEKDMADITFYDENKSARLLIGVNNERSELTFYDEMEIPRIFLVVSEEDEGIEMYDENYNPRVYMGVNDEKVGLDIYDESGTLRVNMDEEGINLLDISDELIWTAP